MKIRKSMIDNAVLIIEPIRTTETGLDESELRELVSYLWQHNPDMVRDIICGDCPEHQ